MASHSRHTKHEFLILVIQVTNVSSIIESFVTFCNFPISKILVSFLFFNLAYLLQIKLWDVVQKKKKKKKTRSEKCDRNSSEILVKHKALVKLQAWHFTSKDSLYGHPKISGCFLIQLLFLCCLICVYT